MLSNLISSTIQNSFNENRVGEDGQARIQVNIATSRDGDEVSSSNNSSTTNTPSLSPGGPSSANPIFSSIFGSLGNSSSSAGNIDLPVQLFGQLFGNLLSNTSANPTVTATSSLANPLSSAGLHLDQPLTELMRMFGSDENDLTPDSTLNIFNVFFQSLRIGDMVSLARGQNRETTFERSRQPLLSYLRSVKLKSTLVSGQI